LLGITSYIHDGGLHDGDNSASIVCDSFNLASAHCDDSSRCANFANRQKLLAERWPNEVDLELNSDHLVTLRRLGECSVTTSAVNHTRDRASVQVAMLLRKRGVERQENVNLSILDVHELGA